MAEEERRRRRRGRRRGRRGDHPGGRPPEEDQAEETEEEEETPSRPRFPFGFGRGRGESGREEGDEEEEEEAGEDERAERRREDREERPVAAAPRSVSPLSFWRRGRARTYREQPMPRQTLGRTWRRIRGLYFPPWVPVAFIILVVFGILGALFFVRGATGAPRIGTDHWHATYQVFVCGRRQPNFPTFDAREGVHTHNDGIIHIHPFIPAGEGAGARLVKWFEYGGGKLTQTEMRMPGDQREFKNSDTCDDGSEAFLRVIVNDLELDDWSRYLPKDGDRVVIEFGSGEETEAVEEDRTVIAETEETRTVELEITGGEGDAAFVPNSIELKRGETARLVVRNTGAISHSLRVAGVDGVYNTSDDFVATSADDSDIIRPGEEGTVVVRFDEEGEFEFQDPSSPNATGMFVVAGELGEETSETGTPEAGTMEAVDVTLKVEMGDDFFEPSELEVEAGQRFRIKLTNNGEFVHNLRITGPDGEYDTGDDLVSTPSPLRRGESGELVGQIDEPGVYSFRDDFHRTEAVGTITVR